MTQRRDPDPAIRDLTTQLGDVLIRRHSTETWCYWIIHVLEILDNHLESQSPGLGDDILVRRLREDLGIRLEYGQWGRTMPRAPRALALRRPCASPLRRPTAAPDDRAATTRSRDY